MAVGLPVSLNKWANLSHITKRGSNEWSSECPQCGDYGHVGGGKPDRFRMFIDGSPRGWCRGCGFFEFAETNGKKLTQQEVAIINTERTRMANEERVRLKEKIAQLERNAEWRGYHDHMDDENRQLWRDAGIDNPYQDWWELGYNPSLTYWHNDTPQTTPALTIPFFGNGNGHVLNVQSRLLEPVDPDDRYRFTKGLPPPLFFPERDTIEHNKSILLVEGAKKAMVTYLFLGNKYWVIGLPNQYITDTQGREIRSLSNENIVVVCLDPNVSNATLERNVHTLGNKADVRIASVPGKIDDLFVKHGASAAAVDSFITQARSV